MWGDAERLGQVVANYLTNALKYSPEGTTVDVRLVVAPHEDRLVRVEVSDHGPGLPPDQQARIWDRFYRAPEVAVLSGSGVGLGLGLYISRAIIARHGGQTGVESAPGAGATFWFALPLLPAAAWLV